MAEADVVDDRRPVGYGSNSGSSFKAVLRIILPPDRWRSLGLFDLSVCIKLNKQQHTPDLCSRDVAQSTDRLSI